MSIRSTAAVLAVLGWAASLPAGAATYYTRDFGPADSTFEILVDGGETNLRRVYNQIEGTNITDWNDLFDLAVLPSAYANGEPGYGSAPLPFQEFFRGDYNITFEVNLAGAQHELTVVDDAGNEVSLGLAPDPTGIARPHVTPGQGDFASITDPWDLRLDVNRHGDLYSLSTDYLWNQGEHGIPNPNAYRNNGIYALIFRTADPYRFVIAFEDLLDGDFDYNDVVLTATFSPAVVPVPPAVALMALGMAGVGALRLRRGRARRS